MISKKARVGRNGQLGFWCGFCIEIVQLTKNGLDAWDERFDHIDDRHFKKGERIEDWFPIDKDVPIRMLQNGGILEGGEPTVEEPTSDDESSEVSTGPGDVYMTTPPPHDHSDSSSNGDGDSPENTHSTPPSMISEFQRPTLPESSSVSRSILGSTSRLNNQPASRKVWFCVSQF